MYARARVVTRLSYFLSALYYAFWFTFFCKISGCDRNKIIGPVNCCWVYFCVWIIWIFWQIWGIWINTFARGIWGPDLRQA